MRELTLAHSSIGGLIHQGVTSQPIRRLTDINISLINITDPSLNLYSTTNQDLKLIVVNVASLYGYYASSIPSTLNFFDSMENPYRVWGIADSTPTLTTAMRGNCGGTCRIYDWTLRKTDAILRSVNPTDTDRSKKKKIHN